MAEESDSGEKTEQPSAHRIEEFRKRGEVASSKELNNVLLLAASVMTLLLTITFIYETMETYIRWLYTLDLEKAYTEKVLKQIMEKTVFTSLKCVGPIAAVAFCVSIMSNLIQIGFLYSPEVLTLKFDRINPINGFKRIFSIRSSLEAVKGLAKFIVILAIVYLYLKDELTSYIGFYHTDVLNSFLYGKVLLAKLGFSILGGMGIIAMADFLYQKMSYQKKLMMTKEQAKQESKEKDGNPEVKQRIKAIQREMTQKRMMADVPTADVIVTNPTHLSIALKYDPETMISPLIVAKGGDNVAMKIREIAKEHDIPIVENVPLARTLYKTVKVGEAVPRIMYKAVAEVLAFVYKIRRRKKAIS